MRRIFYEDEFVRRIRLQTILSATFRYNSLKNRKQRTYHKKLRNQIALIDETYRGAITKVILQNSSLFTTYRTQNFHTTPSNESAQM